MDRETHIGAVGNARAIGLGDRYPKWLPPFITLAACVLSWELFVRSEILPRSLTPTTWTVLERLGELAASGALTWHITYTGSRLLGGFILAAVIGIVVGTLMARNRRAEWFLSPIMTTIHPIPALAWAPLFILWFGLGDTATIALVVTAATPPIVISAWSAIRGIPDLWLRVGRSLGARGWPLFRQVILPAALPLTLTGLRIGLARSWRAVIAGEMIAATDWGLGWVVFDSKEFLNTDTMLAAVLVIGLMGYLIEHFGFRMLEKRTVERWGMLQMAGA